MEISDRDALAIQRAVEDIGAGARSAACETKKYADVVTDNLRRELAAELRRELATQAAKHQIEIDSVAARLNRGAGFVSDVRTDGTNKVIDRNEPATKAFETFVRQGVDRLGETERKLLSVSNDPGGGKVVPSPFVLEEHARRLLARRAVGAEIAELARKAQAKADRAK